MKTCNPLTRVCLACAICVNTSVTQAQTHEDQYAVFRKGKPVGRVMAIQTFSAAGKQTVIKVELSSTIVIPIKVNAATRNQFDGKGVMQSASFIQRATGGFNKNTQITKEGSSYKLVQDGELVRYHTGGIVFTSNMLYFNEPVGISELYSESHLCFVKLVKLATGIYRLHLPDGNHTTYNYSNGKLQSIAATSAMGDVIFKRQNASSYARQ